VPPRLKRCYGASYLHFITTSCYRRRPLFRSSEARDLFLEILEEVRRSYRFVVAGYVVMPEHVHLLIGEPERADPSVVMQVLKQRFTRRLLRAGCSHPSKNAKGGAAAFWQRRFYDFPVWTKEKRIEKLKYMHRNPVKRGLAEAPDQWKWSSFRFYAFGESGPVLVNEARAAQMKVRNVFP
jgi:putative transposase